MPGFVKLLHGGDDDSYLDLLIGRLTAAGVPVRLDGDDDEPAALAVVMTPAADRDDVHAELERWRGPLAAMLRRGRPFLTLAGLGYADLTEQGSPAAVVPGEAFVARLRALVDGAADPDPAIVYRPLPPAVGAELRRRCGLASLATRDSDEQVVWSDIVGYATETLGPDHPVTLAARAEVAFHLRDDAAALAAWIALVADQTRVLGGAHVDTLVSRHEYVQYLEPHARETCEALADLMGDEAYGFGPDHWRTRDTEQDYDFNFR